MICFFFFACTESLVRIRALLPIQLHAFHQITVQNESLEAGHAEISQWLQKAEEFLSTMTPPKSKDEAQSQLERHKAFFARTLYYQSMLNSKNKMLQTIMQQNENVKTQDVLERMTGLNTRFQEVTQQAQSVQIVSILSII